MQTNIMPLIIAGLLMFAVIGGLSLLSGMFTLNGIKSKSIGQGQHGTTRWATKSRVNRTFQRVAFEPELWREGNALTSEHHLIYVLRQMVFFS